MHQAALACACSTLARSSTTVTGLDGRGGRAVPLALAAAVVDTMGISIAMPVLPKLIMEVADVSVTEAAVLSGWMLAAYAVMQLLAGPLTGALGDRFGRRPVLIAAMVASVADCALTALAPSIAWLFAGRIIAGLTGATIGPISAVLADVSPPEKRASGFGLVGAAYGVGMTLGPAIGGFAADWGTRAPFWIAAGLSAINAIAIFFFLPETLAEEKRRPIKAREANIVGAFRPLFAVTAAGPLLAAWFLWQVADQVYPATWSFWGTQQFDWSSADIGWTFAWMGLTELVVQVTLTERLVARWGEWRVGLVGLASGAFGTAGMALLSDGWQVYPMLLVGGLGALAWPALNGLLSRLVDESRQGVLQGGINGINSVAAAIGPIAATQALAWGGGHGVPGLAFLLAGSVIAASCLTIAFLVPREVPQAGTDGTEEDDAQAEPEGRGAPAPYAH